MFDGLVKEKILIEQVLSLNDNLSSDDLASHLNSLSPPPEIIFSPRKTGDALNVKEAGYICRILQDYSYTETRVFNLDPITTTLLLNGLLGILNWLSAERRHKEILGESPPPPPPVARKIFNEQEKSCSYVEKNSVCGLPFSKIVQIKGEGYLIILKACSHRPKPHETCEYYEL